MNLKNKKKHVKEECQKTVKRNIFILMKVRKYAKTSNMILGRCFKWSPKCLTTPEPPRPMAFCPHTFSLCPNSFWKTDRFQFILTPLAPSTTSYERKRNRFRIYREAQMGENTESGGESKQWLWQWTSQLRALGSACNLGATDTCAWGDHCVQVGI